MERPPRYRSQEHCGVNGTALAGRALEGGAANVAITAALQAQGVSTDATDYLHALGMGMALGGAFGMAGKNPHTRDMAARTSEAGKSLMVHAETLAARDMSPSVLEPKAPAPPSTRTHYGDVPSGFSNWSKWVADTVEDPFNTTATAEHITRAARLTNPDLFGKVDALDERIAEAHGDLAEYKNQQRRSAFDFSPYLLEPVKGKSKRAQAQALNAQQAGEAARESRYRQSITALQNERARLGPEVNAARVSAEPIARAQLEAE